MTDHLNRRACLGAVLTAGAAVALPAAAASTDGPALAGRSHFYARPEFRDPLSDCFTRVLGCPPPRVLPVPGFPQPILAFNFPGGGSVSVEFTPEALDPAQMRHGAWLELRSPDAPALQKAVLAAGLPQIRYAATSAFYFAAPGGQVFSIVKPPVAP